ncbi:hypothetical protein JL722_14407 [Aureococcus anophagefferens]|nr:hypothetical protein JL722_14407 [Aureococcus anophagefferens]
MGNWERAFALGTACYVAAFSACVYAHTASAVAKMGVSLLASALPALLATELCGGDEAGGGELARTWLQEFVGTAVMVALTCCPGAAVGHLGRAYEYGAHWVAMVAADYSCGGPQVNPVITVAMLVARGGSAVEALVRIMAQVGAASSAGGSSSGESFLTGAVGGPAPDAHLPLFYVFWSECLGACALALAVFAFATTKFFQEGDNYLVKMACINVVLRCVILGHGATGPAVNPALASSYAFAASGAWPPLEDGSPHYVAFWAGGLCARRSRARLRRDIAEEFVEGPPRGAWDKVLVSLVAEALESLGCPNSYAVFLPESRAGRRDFLADRGFKAVGAADLATASPCSRRCCGERARARREPRRPDRGRGGARRVLASRLASIRDRSAAAPPRRARPKARSGARRRRSRTPAPSPRTRGTARTGGASTRGARRPRRVALGLRNVAARGARDAAAGDAALAALRAEAAASREAAAASGKGEAALAPRTRLHRELADARRNAEASGARSCSSARRPRRARAELAAAQHALRDKERALEARRDGRRRRAARARAAAPPEPAAPPPLAPAPPEPAPPPPAPAPPRAAAGADGAAAQPPRRRGPRLGGAAERGTSRTASRARSGKTRPSPWRTTRCGASWTRRGARSTRARRQRSPSRCRRAPPAACCRRPRRGRRRRSGRRGSS